MATRQTTAGATSTALLDTANGDRERVFDAFRQWGYLEADLDPLGFLPKSPHPELQIAGEPAREVRQVYCGTVGVEFMHICEPDLRKWIQECMEGPQSAVDQGRLFDEYIRATRLDHDVIP